MKGAIVQCLGELVSTRFGENKWQESLEKAGMSRTSFFMPLSNIDDVDVMKLLKSVCNVTHITPAQAADAFGDYWVNVYAPKIYTVYYKGSNCAKELILKMDGVHDIVTKNIPNARPPRFEYNWKDDRTLIIDYKSHRGMIDIFVGLIKGVGKYYNENLFVSKLGHDRVQVIFPS
jgi:hypothetical protein